MAESLPTNYKPSKTITRITLDPPDMFDVTPGPRKWYSWTPRQAKLAQSSLTDSTRLPSQPLKTHAHDKSSVEIAALKPKDWKRVSVKHRVKFERLSEVWKNAKSDPELIKIINANGVCFKEEFSIGNGSYGTEVYVCLGSDGIERAIKRLPKVLCTLLKNERDILMSRNAVVSPRVVNYWFYDDTSSPDFGYLILNLYEQNLEEFIKEKGETITESRARKMIRQVLEGLKALHAREPRILHRDLKPTNILVDASGDLVLSDFGIGRFFPEQGATAYCTGNERGSKGWIAYECIDWDGLYSDEVRDPSDGPVQFKWKEKSDIQVAGMIAFYILTKGKHPFGPPIHQMINLHNGKPVGLSKLSDPVVKDLLSQMLAQKLDERPYVEQALKHPYFLSSEEQMTFLEALGNEPEIKSFWSDPNCAVSRELDNRDLSKPRSSLLPFDWKAVIDPDDLNTFCAGGHTRPSSFDGIRYTHCLRFIRNARQHWGDKPRPPLKAMGTATSPDEYFLYLFPTLPLVVHQIIRSHPDWKTRHSLKEFFPVINRRVLSVDED
ncbi:serine threonine- kinase endoribonuclease IRE1-like isoform X1 [Paramuricea clavata]|uniref:Serine threonine- kinase endoribonuclease IRE1-like isoform X1 n=1 Tax=Paramuricea clavata TaxID=317549 RepID=A0A7D9EP15_PARCT|nr:serine threonine- kinase endoribonuclease IRE1-like isoform X1 [Paramuricea clavata]